MYVVCEILVCHRRAQDYYALGVVLLHAPPLEKQRKEGAFPGVGLYVLRPPPARSGRNPSPFLLNTPYLSRFVCFNSVHTRCIAKTSGFIRGVCKNLGFNQIQRFSCGNSREQAILRKSKTPQKSRQKSGLSEPRLLQCT